MEYRISVRDYCNLLEQNIVSVLTEGKTYSDGSITFRIDSPNAYLGQQVHVHVNQNNLHYAWNKDGSRSHKGQWPNREPSKRIREIAANQLGISIDMLESVMDCALVSENVDEGLGALLESIGFERNFNMNEEICECDLKNVIKKVSGK